MLKKIAAAALIVLVGLSLGGCNTDATVASHNLSKAAEQFQIDRRVVFYNGISSEYMLSIEGKCSIVADGMDKQLEVTCKTGPDEYKKHYLGLADNIGYFAEQIEGANVSVYNYKVIFKPQSILNDYDLVVE